MNWLTWALLSAVFAAATAILAKIGLNNVNSNLATAIRTGVVMIFAWSIVLVEGHIGQVTTWSRRTWVFLTLSGIATGLSWLCYFRALQLGPASAVAPIDKVSVILVVAFAAAFLGETVTWKTALGATLIAIGAIVLAMR
jgi:transporter family protein